MIQQTDKTLYSHTVWFLGRLLNLNYVILLKICFCLRQLAYKTSKGVSLVSKGTFASQQRLSITYPPLD